MFCRITASTPRRSFSNVIISHPKRRITKPTSLLPLDDPDLHTKVKVSPNGIKFFRHRQYVAPSLPKERKPRGEVTGFTKSSQRAFRDTLIRLDLAPYMGTDEGAESNNGFFISLDWPRESEWTQETIANDLDRLSKRFNKRFGNSLLGSIWKKEIKANGTPHLHIIALFNTHLDTLTVSDWVKQAWSEITGSFELYGTDVRPLYGDPSRLINYLLKPYSEIHAPQNIGRIWGKWCAKTLPLLEPKTLGMSKEDYSVFLERLKGTPQAQHCKMIRDFTENWMGGRVLGHGETLRELLNDLPSDEVQKLWGER